MNKPKIPIIMTNNAFIDMTHLKGGRYQLREYCCEPDMMRHESSELSEILNNRLIEEKDEIENFLETNDIKEIEYSDNHDEVEKHNSLLLRLKEIKQQLEDRFDFSFDITIPVYSFYIATYPTTQEQWIEIMGENNSIFKGKKRPVENIKWIDALEFCNRLSEKFGLQKAYKIIEDEITFEIVVTLIESSNGYRLPDHIQWQYAMEGGRKSDEGGKYLEETPKDEIGWFADCFDRDSTLKAYFRKSGTQQVGKKRPNILGIYDMLGNIREMCWDRKWTYQYAKLIESSIEQKMKIQNINGPEGVDYVYAMGGSWEIWHHNYFCFSSDYYTAPDEFLISISRSNHDVGFRVILPDNNG